ncbi:predicted protein [Lichtheimia corymbifera JMRC:FSU:9682]|uniref:Uncharacterized protein n=1 Tax=Lichtheimia corymbifera JMRC:FSU:9682 TaxID=1263082 RepID=A0A068RWQ3_9FUNG|nr:predicted protein [Lichtheimia corymbifera JMRC:FSU:9682]
MLLQREPFLPLQFHFTQPDNHDPIHIRNNFYVKEPRLGFFFQDNFLIMQALTINIPSSINICYYDPPTHQGKQKESMGLFNTMYILINNQDISETSNMMVDYEDVALAATHMQSSPGRATIYERDGPTAGWKRKHTSSNLGLSMVMERWMQSSAVIKKKPWNVVTMVTWRVVSRNDGPYHVDTAEDGGMNHGVLHTSMYDMQYSIQGLAGAISLQNIS